MRFFIAAALLGAALAFPAPQQLDASAVTAALNALVAADTNRATGNDLTVDYQDMASHTHFDHDNAHKPFFTTVSSTLLAKDTYAKLNALAALYVTPDVDTPEPANPSAVSAASAFLDSALSTPVLQSAWQFLQQQGLASKDQATFKAALTQLWFTNYARNKVAGSSGFESVFVGETSKGATVVRFNNWLRMFSQESAGKLKYHGWFTRAETVAVSLQFAWNSAAALETSMFLNSSPEFELAVYTVCALAGNGQCSMSINGDEIAVHATTLQSNGKTVIDEAFPTGSGGSHTKTTHNPNHSKTTRSPPVDNSGLQDLITKMRAADSDRAIPDTDYKLNWGKHVSGEQDESPNPLFTSVDESKIFSRKMYKDLIEIYNQNLFTPDVCVAEPPMSGFRRTYLKTLIADFQNTTVWQLAYSYLQSKGVVKDTFQDDLFTLWFGTYSRCKGTLGSSGWEHVFSGEWRSGEVDGQHNWVRYYLLEKAGKINYHGYDSYDAELTGTFQYTWEKTMKKVGGFLIGTSPAFDFSVFTTCVLTSPGNKACRFTIDSFNIEVTSYKQQCAQGVCLSTSYPSD